MQMEGKKYYIAYGSNLSVEQMAYRCPGAKVAGMAALKGWKLVFRNHATIEKADGRVVPAIVWEITSNDERNLDRYESYPSYYRKENLPITMTDLDGKNPRQVTAMVYLMNDGRPQQAPWDAYYRVLEEGYRRFGFNPYLLETALAESE